MRLLEEFEEKIGSRTPGRTAAGIARATPLVDLTADVIECARTEYGITLPSHSKVFGKLDSGIFGGSVKVRPAVEILRDAIASGRLKKGQAIFEATSGNFGIALGLMKGIGFNVVCLVSRKLEKGVIEELERSGARIVSLDVEICPVPGAEAEIGRSATRASAESVKAQLVGMGFSEGQFDAARKEIEEALSRQDAIGLAKTLATAYSGFCPEQYDNELNVKAHEATTAPEIEAQLDAVGIAAGEARIVTAFGTGGTSAGISRYMEARHGRKLVHVVYPREGQDVAGIRTKPNAAGLRFYMPERYGGEHEVDFEEAKKALRFFASKGHDIGESSALALYGCIQLLNFGVGETFVVVLADGIAKYARDIETKVSRRLDVTVQEVAAMRRKPKVVWTHGAFVPNAGGLRMLSSVLGTGEAKVVPPDEVMALLQGDAPEDAWKGMETDGEVLLVCMAGGTSLEMARRLSKRGVQAQSLSGGMMAIAAAHGKRVGELVKQS